MPIHPIGDFCLRGARTALMPSISRLVVGLTVVLAVVSLGCGDEPGECTSETACVCQGGGSCKMDCDEGHCTFETSGGSDAEFSCDGGGCSLEASGDGTVELSCDGGRCTVEHTGDGEVILDCDGGDCTLTRAGTGTVRSE